MKSSTPYRFLFAGGGTGGHLYPAIAVADEIKRLKPESEIIFVGICLVYRQWNKLCITKEFPETTWE